MLVSSLPGNLETLPLTRESLRQPQRPWLRVQAEILSTIDGPPDGLLVDKLHHSFSSLPAFEPFLNDEESSLLDCCNPFTFVIAS